MAKFNITYLKNLKYLIYSIIHEEHIPNYEYEI